MRITDNGLVGIGTTNPLSKLSVGGSGNSKYTIDGESSGSANAGIFGSNDSDGYGVYGSNSGLAGIGVYGKSTYAGLGYGVMGSGYNGVYGIGSSYDFYAPTSTGKEFLCWHGWYWYSHPQL